MTGIPAVVGAIISWSPMMSPATGMLFMPGAIIVPDGLITVFIIGSDQAACIGIEPYAGMGYVGVAYAAANGATGVP